MSTRGQHQGADLRRRSRSGIDPSSGLRFLFESRPRVSVCECDIKYAEDTSFHVGKISCWQAKRATDGLGGLLEYVPANILEPHGCTSSHDLCDGATVYATKPRRGSFPETEHVHRNARIADSRQYLEAKASVFIGCFDALIALTYFFAALLRNRPQQRATKNEDINLAAIGPQGHRHSRS